MTRSPCSLPPRSATTTPRSRIRRRPPRVPAASKLRSAAGPRWRYGRALLRRARRLPLDRSLPRGPRDQSSRRRVEAHEHRPHPRTRSPPRRLRPLILEYRPTAARGQPPFELIASGVRLHSCGRHHHGDQSPRHHGDTRPGQVGSRAHTTLPRSHQHVLVDRPAETHHLIEVVRGGPPRGAFESEVARELDAVRGKKVAGNAVRHATRQPRGAAVWTMSPRQISRVTSHRNWRHLVKDRAVTWCTYTQLQPLVDPQLGHTKQDPDCCMMLPHW